MDATAYLKKVEDRARELYALSDQGPWEALAPWMQQSWIGAADEEIKAENDGRRI